MKKVLCFGELLLRMSPELNREWIHKGSMPVFIGGAELNVAQALALWGSEVTYCTALPPHALAQEILQELQDKGIDTSSVFFSDGRIGIYYLPQGADLKNAGVIYDRAYSSFWELKPGMLDWRNILKEIDWFHFSAITPALNETLADVCEEALQVAQSMGIHISVDLNYRAKLWKYGKDPVEIMPRLVKYCNTIMGNLWSAKTLLGNPLDAQVELTNTKDAYIDEARRSADHLFGKYSCCRNIAYTFRFDQDNELKYYGALMTKDELCISREYHSNRIVDKVGSGDCFMAGLIYSYLNSLGLKDTIEFATAAAFGKLHVKGDVTTQTVQEINLLMNEQ